MSESGALWPPRVGDSVLIDATGAGGSVEDIIDGGDGRWFVVTTSHALPPERRRYRLEALAPPPMA